MTSSPHSYPPPPLEGATRLLATLSVAAAVFMNVLDMTITNVSVPAIAGDLGASPNQGTWVITSFSVANAVSIPLTGWLSQRFGQVRLFLISNLLFVLASLLCGLSTSLEMLVGFRVLQGLVAGPMMPLSQTIIMQCYPPSKVGVAITIWALTTLVGPVLGPNLGGLITDNFSWPWIFFINVPIGFLTLWLSWTLLKDRDSPRVRAPVDRAGLMLLVVWVAALQLMLDKGRELDWFNSGEIVALAVVAAVAFVFFLIWELYADHPVVELRLFRDRNLAVGTVVGACGFGIYFGGVVLLPLWMQQTLGYPATLAGLLSSPVGVVAMLLSPLVGKFLLPRLDVRYLTTFAFLVFFLGNLMRSGFVVGIDTQAIVMSQMVMGVGVACFFVPLTTLSFSNIPAHKMPAAAGMNNFARIMSSAFFTSVFITLWDSWAAAHHARLVTHISPFDEAAVAALDRLQSAGLTREGSLGLLDWQINMQAHTMAFDDLFWGTAMVYIVMIPLIWLARPAKPGHGSAVAAGE